MPSKSPASAATARRREQVADLYVRGFSQSAIAAQLNVTQGTVSRDLKQIEGQWRASGIRKFDIAREVELQKLDRLEREAWAAWERSQKPTQSAVVTEAGTSQQTRKSMRHQYGDPRFLDQVNKCICQRRALLGLDAPLQINDVTPQTTAETVEQRRARLQKIFEAASLALAVSSAPLALPAPSDDGRS
jgi:predicted transcriptional regulator